MNKDKATSRATQDNSALAGTISKVYSTEYPVVPNLIISGNVGGNLDIDLNKVTPVKQSANVIGSANINTSSSEAESARVIQSNPFTVIYYGVGLFILLLTIMIGWWWLKRQFGITSMRGGEMSLDSMQRWTSEKMKNNIDPVRQAIYAEVEQELLSKLNRLNKLKR